MALLKTKSKKQSDTWKLLEGQYRLFLDRNQGNKIMPDLLRKAGLRVVCHSERYADDAMPDPDWIEDCSKQADLIVITGDKAIETDPINRRAVIDCRAKIFLLEENNSRAIEWASVIIVARRRILELAHSIDGPFFASVKKHSRNLVSEPRKP
jgi:hypothetical protein